MKIRILLGWLPLLGLLFPITSWSAMKTLTVTVVSSSVPEGQGVYLTGNHPVLGDWHPSHVRMERSEEGWIWSGSFPAGSEVAFKVTRGDWDTEALAEDGGVPPDMRVVLDEDMDITLGVPEWKDQRPPVAGGITGEVRYHRNLEGGGAPARDVVVWLPPGYEGGNGHYPVLYMHDGQNVFDPATSFLGIDWGVDETADRLIGEGLIRPVIVVAMNNTPLRREEYGADAEASGAYMSFVVDTVKPMIDSTYRTLPGRDDTFVMGSSMGGCISWLLAWNYPHIFSGAGCLSPAFMFAEILPNLEAYEGPPLNLKVYLDNGGVGMDKDRMQPVIDAFLEILDGKAKAAGIDYAWFLDEEAEHNEAAWAKRVWRPLVYLLGTGDDQP
ncbi:MAG TPA: alpha/beta hydrolase-fold protein [Kiritimatiellia bacterium]|nr:alpha/beta hydrolase-fold protein [Kiritimatiellia bacterium]